nr:PEP-CTERM sorting domain-containing protein [Leptolyngbyaceae cyanobacterium MAG.088]
PVVVEPISVPETVLDPVLEPLPTPEPITDVEPGPVSVPEPVSLLAMLAVGSAGLVLKKQ